METVSGYILYVDILGYRNLLNDNEGESERLKTLIEEFSGSYIYLNVCLAAGVEFDESKLLTRSFSDNFLIVYKSSIGSLSELKTIQTAATLIQSRFLNSGLLTRGSITYGEISYTDKIVYGRDLIKAVELEEGHNEPSVVIDAELQSVFTKNNEEYKEHNSLFKVWNNSEDDYLDVVRGIKKYIEWLNRLLPSRDVTEKIEWIINQVNDYFAPLAHNLTLVYEPSVILLDRNKEL